MYVKENPRFERKPDEGAPYPNPAGWYRLVGDDQLYGNVWVSGNARVLGDAQVSGNAQVFGNVWVSGDAQVFGNARVSGNAQVFGNVWVSGNARVFGNAQVSGDAQVFGNARVSGDAQVFGDAQVSSGNLIGLAISAVAMKWVLSLSAPGVVTVGCQTHPVKEWLKAGKSDVPWDSYTTRGEKAVIIAIIKTVIAQEKLGKTWEK